MGVIFQIFHFGDSAGLLDSCRSLINHSEKDNPSCNATTDIPVPQ